MADATAALNEAGEAESHGTPVLEWVAGGLGAVLTLGLLGFLSWEAWRHDPEARPELAVALVRVAPAGTGWLAEVAAVNGSDATAAGVVVEGVLRWDGQEVERSSAPLDYVPGRSEARGGLLFSQDPREGELELRALGYAEP